MGLNLPLPLGSLLTRALLGGCPLAVGPDTMGAKRGTPTVGIVKARRDQGLDGRVCEEERKMEVAKQARAAWQPDGALNTNFTFQTWACLRTSRHSWLAASPWGTAAAPVTLASAVPRTQVNLRAKPAPTCGVSMACL